MKSTSRHLVFASLCVFPLVAGAVDRDYNLGELAAQGRASRALSPDHFSRSIPRIDLRVGITQESFLEGNNTDFTVCHLDTVCQQVPSPGNFSPMIGLGGMYGRFDSGGGSDGYIVALDVKIGAAFSATNECSFELAPFLRVGRNFAEVDAGAVGGTGTGAYRAYGLSLSGLYTARSGFQVGLTASLMSTVIAASYSLDTPAGIVTVNARDEGNVMAYGAFIGYRF